VVALAVETLALLLAELVQTVEITAAQCTPLVKLEEEAVVVALEPLAVTQALALLVLAEMAPLPL
jgi:hypothetical protein